MISYAVMIITPFVKEGQSQAPSVSFLPGAMPRQHYIMCGFLSSIQNREAFRARGIDFRGLLCYNDGRKGLRNRCLHRPDLCQSLKRRVLLIAISKPSIVRTTMSIS